MSKTLTIFDKLYEELQKPATANAMSVENFAEKLLAEVLISSEESILYKRKIIDSIFSLHKYMEERYGIVVDSVDMIREDRDYLLP